MQSKKIDFFIEDFDSFHDFHDALSDYAPMVENLLVQLRQMPTERALLADLFRVFHNIKGDAALCRLPFLVPFIHAVEALLSRLRTGEVLFSAVVADVLLLAFDRLLLTVETLSKNEAASDLHLGDFTVGLDGLKDLPASALDAGCQRLIDMITGALTDEVTVRPALSLSDVEQSEDMQFFYQLALQLENRSTWFSGRTERNLKLALLTNEYAGAWVKQDQLRAAVYLHDIGMMFLPEEIWLGTRALKPQERQLLTQHPYWAAGFLLRMRGWEEAAQMVLQHHEKPDGSGYPRGLSGNDIVAGAKILALVDAFESVMVKQNIRKQQRSLLRAAAEVNASDHQFDRAWVEPFNRAIRFLGTDGSFFKTGHNL